MSQQLLICNWKMALGLTESHELSNLIADALPQPIKDLQIAVCPSYVALTMVKANLPVHVMLGAQDVFWGEPDPGAFTGEIAASDLREAGCDYVIVGHSERRALGETDEQVGDKVLAALNHHLTPIVCVGETRIERQKKQTEKVVLKQLKAAFKKSQADSIARFVIAYEPRWAIGTGENCDPAEANRVQYLIREFMQKKYQVSNRVLVLYGGSVTGTNLKSYLRQSSIDGVLVGAASQSVAKLTSLLKAALK